MPSKAEMYGTTSPKKVVPSNFKISYGKAGDVQGTSKASKQADREIVKLKAKGRGYMKGQ